MTSVSVPYGYSIDLYEDDNFSGSMLTVDGVPSTDPNGKVACVNMPGDFNDKLSSAVVRRTSSVSKSSASFLE